MNQKLVLLSTITFPPDEIGFTSVLVDQRSISHLLGAIHSIQDPSEDAISYIRMSLAVAIKCLKMTFEYLNHYNLSATLG